MSINNATGYYFRNDVTSFTSGMFYRNGCNNSDVKQNRFITTSIDLNYGASAVTGPQGNKGNIWTPGPLTIGPFHANATLAGMSSYICAVSQMPPSVFPPTGWFFPTGTSVGLQACGGITGGGGTSSLSSGTLTNMLTSNENEGFAEGTFFEMQRQLYAELKFHPESTSEDISFENFQSDHDNSQIGKLFSINQRINNLFNLDESTQQILDDLKVNVKNDLNQRALIYEDLEGEPENSDLLHQLSSLLSSLKGYYNTYEGLESSIQSNKISEAQLAWNENNQFIPNNLPAENEKSFNTIYLEVIIMGQRTLNQNDKEIIENIANQCFSEGGRAVFRARSWHYKLTGKLIGASDCTSPQNKSVDFDRQNILSSQNLIIIPNPNKGNMLIKFDEITSETNSLKIFDIFGKQLYSNELEIGQNSKTVALEKLPAGIYFAVLKDSTGIRVIEKVIIN